MLPDLNMKVYTIIFWENKMNSFSHDKNEYICIRSFFMQSRKERMEKEAKKQKDMEYYIVH